MVINRNQIYNEEIDLFIVVSCKERTSTAT